MALDHIIAALMALGALIWFVRAWRTSVDRTFEDDGVDREAVYVPPPTPPRPKPKKIDERVAKAKPAPLKCPVESSCGLEIVMDNGEIHTYSGRVRLVYLEGLGYILSTGVPRSSSQGYAYTSWLKTYTYTRGSIRDIRLPTGAAK